MAQYFDQFGILHHADTKTYRHLTSENGPMFSGAYYIEKEQLTATDRAAIRKILNSLYDGERFRTTPGSESERFSHDNFKGVICLIRALEVSTGERCDLYRKWMPLFHKQLIRPDNFIIVGFFKCPWLFFPFLPYVWFTMALTCWQTFKTRGDQDILKTDGKILTRMLCKAFRFDLVYGFCTLILNRNRQRDVKSDYEFRLTWPSVYRIYFRENNHPLRGIKEL